MTHDTRVEAQGPPAQETPGLTAEGLTPDRMVLAQEWRLSTPHMELWLDDEQHDGLLLVLTGSGRDRSMPVHAAIGHAAGALVSVVWQSPARDWTVEQKETAKAKIAEVLKRRHEKRAEWRARASV